MILAACCVFEHSTQAEVGPVKMEAPFETRAEVYIIREASGAGCADDLAVCVDGRILESGLPLHGVDKVPVVPEPRQKKWQPSPGNDAVRCVPCQWAVLLRAKQGNRRDVIHGCVCARRGAGIRAEQRVSIGKVFARLNFKGVVVVASRVGQKIRAGQGSGCGLVLVDPAVDDAFLKEVHSTIYLPGKLLLDAEAPVQGACLVQCRGTSCKTGKQRAAHGCGPV